MVSLLARPAGASLKSLIVSPALLLQMMAILYKQLQVSEVTQWYIWWIPKLGQ